MMMVRSAMVLGFVGATTPAFGQSIQFIDVPHGLGPVQSLAISGDGSTIVGYASVGSARSAFNWNRATGTAGMMPTMPGFESAQAAAVSHDGGVIVGRHDPASSLSGGTSAARWETGAAYELGTLPGRSQSLARGVSADGSVVTGVSYSGAQAASDMRGFRWTAGVGMQDIGTLPGTSGTYANAISTDGSTIVGVGLRTGPALPFRWSGSGGIQALDMPSGAYTAWPEAVSADGSVVVGAAQGGEPWHHAAIWEGGSAALLHALPGMDHSWASAVAADGSLIVGHAIDFAGRAGGHAVVWDEHRQMLDLEAFAASMGVDLSGWELWSATGVSADGMRIVGMGLHEAGPGEWHEGAWVISIPAPGAIGVLGVGLAMGMRRRR